LSTCLLLSRPTAIVLSPLPEGFRTTRASRCLLPSYDSDSSFLCPLLLLASAKEQVQVSFSALPLPFLPEKDALDRLLYVVLFNDGFSTTFEVDRKLFTRLYDETCPPFFGPSPQQTMD